MVTANLNGQIIQLLNESELNDPGPLAEITWRDKTKLYIDDRYQRGVDSVRSQKIIDGIARKFQWKKFGILQTTLLGAVIDGQHRHAAALRRPDITNVPCMVWDIEPNEAALLFVGLNRDRVNITHQAVFKAELEARDPVALGIMAICKEVGVVPLTYSLSLKKIRPNETTATQTLKHQYNVDPKRMKETLECCLKARVLMSSTILMMVFRELTLGGTAQRVLVMLGAAAANYVPSGHLTPVSSTDKPPEQTTAGVKKYESGTFMDILLRTFQRANLKVEAKNTNSWRRTEFIIDGKTINLAGAVERANQLREASGFAPIKIPR